MNSASPARFAFLSAGIFGALGAHALESFLVEKGMLHAWETAARYHVVHAVALFGAAVWARQARANEIRWVRWSVRCWSVGIALFSGSLYLLAIGGPRWLGPVTPLGGLALLGGWLGVVAAAFTKSE
jgi:uncharacterized membrane protein YgdD (TMEM256/DUF423 family)